MNIEESLATIDSQLRERLLLYLALTLPSYTTHTSKKIIDQLFNEERLILENEEIYRRRLDELRQKNEIEETLELKELQSKHAKEQRIQLELIFSHLKLLESLSIKQVELMLSKLKDKSENVLSELRANIKTLETYTRILKQENKQQYQELQKTIQNDFQPLQAKGHKILVDDEKGKYLDVDMDAISDAIKANMLESVRNEKRELNANTKGVVEEHFRKRIKDYIGGLISRGEKTSKESLDEDYMMRLNSKNMHQVETSINSQLENSGFNKKIEGKLEKIKENDKRIQLANGLISQFKKEEIQLNQALKSLSNTNNTNSMGNNLNQIMVTDPENPGSRKLVSQTTFELESLQEKVDQASSSLLDFSNFMAQAEQAVVDAPLSLSQSEPEQRVSSTPGTLFPRANSTDDTPAAEQGDEEEPEPTEPSPTRKFIA